MTPRTRGAAPAPAAPTPWVALHDLRSVWLQVTGTLCNLACRHCFNASGPRAPWLGSLDATAIRAAIAEAEGLGVKELYFTGGEPFLHPDLLALLETALAVAPTTVLTNGTLVDDLGADRLAAIAASSAYSLEVRVSVEADTAEANDRVRGRGSFARALAAVRRLDARGVPPIVTATKIVASRAGPTLYERLRACLLAAGVRRPRVKILPVLPLGRCAWRADERCLTADDLEAFDVSRLPCAETRVVADGGVYACPILAGLPGARLSDGRLADALGPASLYHPVCVTCHATGLACRNH
ncbi:MAG TPA: radical SAM protein [Methylomirabilota bacterium]|nr:radical SAM protein [Methylomirabilota bacterium]